MIGHSMANSTVTDPTWSGAAVQSGWTLRDDGANIANYPTGNAPGQSILPYLVEETIAQGAVSGTRHIIRRGANSISVGPSSDTLLAGMRDDVAVLGGLDILLIWIGANDAQTQAEYDAIASETAGLRRLVRLARAEFPDVPILLIGEETDDPDVSYPFVDDINNLRQTIAAEIAFVRYVSIAGVTLTDDIHPDVAGYAFVADAVSDLWLGQ